MTAPTVRETYARLLHRSFTALYWTERFAWAPQVARLRCAACGGALMAIPPTMLPGRIECFACSREYGEIQTRRPPVLDFTKGEPVAIRRGPRGPRGPAYVSQPQRLLRLLQAGPVEIDVLVETIGCNVKQLRRNARTLRRQGHDIRCASRHYVLIQPKGVGV